MKLNGKIMDFFLLHLIHKYALIGYRYISLFKWSDWKTINADKSLEKNASSIGKYNKIKYY